MITVTDSASLKIKDLLLEENDPTLKVRAFVKGGGCSGFQYGFTMDSEVNEDDFVFGDVVIDSMSSQYMTGAVIDYKEDAAGSQFSITNPSATTTCGCGSSFGV